MYCPKGRLISLITGIVGLLIGIVFVCGSFSVMYDRDNAANEAFYLGSAIIDDTDSAKTNVLDDKYYCGGMKIKGQSTTTSFLNRWDECTFEAMDYGWFRRQHDFCIQNKETCDSNGLSSLKGWNLLFTEAFGCGVGIIVVSCIMLVAVLRINKILAYISTALYGLVFILCVIIFAIVWASVKKINTECLDRLCQAIRERGKTSSDNYFIYGLVLIFFTIGVEVLSVYGSYYMSITVKVAPDERDSDEEDEDSDDDEDRDESIISLDKSKPDHEKKRKIRPNKRRRKSKMKPNRADNGQDTTNALLKTGPVKGNLESVDENIEGEDDIDKLSLKAKDSKKKLLNESTKKNLVNGIKEITNKRMNSGDISKTASKEYTDDRERKFMEEKPISENETRRPRVPNVFVDLEVISIGKSVINEKKTAEASLKTSKPDIKDETKKESQNITNEPIKSDNLNNSKLDENSAAVVGKPITEEVKAENIEMQRGLIFKEIEIPEISDSDESDKEKEKEKEKDKDNEKKKKEEKESQNNKEIGKEGEMKKENEEKKKEGDKNLKDTNENNRLKIIEPVHMETKNENNAEPKKYEDNETDKNKKSVKEEKKIQEEKKVEEEKKIVEKKETEVKVEVKVESQNKTNSAKEFAQKYGATINKYILKNEEAKNFYNEEFKKATNNNSISLKIDGFVKYATGIMGKNDLPELSKSDVELVIRNLGKDDTNGLSQGDFEQMLREVMIKGREKIVSKYAIIKYEEYKTKKSAEELAAIKANINANKVPTSIDLEEILHDSSKLYDVVIDIRRQQYPSYSETDKLTVEEVANIIKITSEKYSVPALNLADILDFMSDFGKNIRKYGLPNLKFSSFTALSISSGFLKEAW